MMDGNSAITFSDYERLRLENIARNQLFLREIGLAGSSSLIDQTSAPELNTSKKRRHVQPISIEHVPAELCRRSSRIVSKALFLQISTDTEIQNSVLPPKSSDIPVDRPKKTALPRTPTAPSADSSRARDASLVTFFGAKFGRPVESFGKAAVMTEANNGKLPKFSKYSGVAEWRNCVFLWMNIFPGGSSSPEGVYPNEFSQDGRLISWFGGSRMTEDTEVVKRIVKAGSRRKPSTVSVSEENLTDRGSCNDPSAISSFAAIKDDTIIENVDPKPSYDCASGELTKDTTSISDTSSSNNGPGGGSDSSGSSIGGCSNRSIGKKGGSDSGISGSSSGSSSSSTAFTPQFQEDEIVLFARLEGENYICLGRLCLVSSELKGSPIKIIWELVDYDRLTDSAYMKRILKISGTLIND